MINLFADMFKHRRPSGWANPRAKPFVGGRASLTRFNQLYGALITQSQAKRKRGYVSEFPSILQFQTQTGCNSSCAYCPQKKIRDMFPEASMSDVLFRKIVDQCSKYPQLRGVGFVLHNEPLLDPTLFEKIRYFRSCVESKAMTFLVTNGTLLSPEVADSLLKSGLDALHISCNGFGKEDFEAINQGKSWENFKNNLENFLTRDLSQIAVMLSFVRSNLYRKELEKAIRYWRSRGVPCYIHGINNRGGLVENYESYARPLNHEKFSIRLRKKGIKSLLRGCPYPFLQMSVLANGQVLICTHDWGRRQIIGDLNELSIQEVWDGPKMREIRLKHLSSRYKSIPSCRDCDVFENAAFL